MKDIKGKAKSALEKATDTLKGHNGNSARASAIVASMYGTAAAVNAGIAIGFSAPSDFIIAAGMLPAAAINATVSHQRAREARKSKSQPAI